MSARGVAVRRGILLLTFVVGALLSVVAWAWACAPQAQVELDQKVAVAGTEINGEGEGFNGTPAAEEVEIHFNALKGDVVATERPDATGNISFSFTIPDVKPGYYTIVATQYDVRGEPVPGTPARASLRVLPAQPPAKQPAPPAAREQREPEPVRQPAAAPMSEGNRAPANKSEVAAASEGGRSAARRPAKAQANAPAAAQAPRRAPAGERAVIVAPVQEPARSGGGGGLAVALVLSGLVLTLAAVAMVIAGRRSDKAVAARAGR